MMPELNMKPHLNVFGMGLPSAIAISGLIVSVIVLFNTNGKDREERARELEKFENRLDQMDKSRELARTEYDKKLTPLLDANLPYRMTFLEASVVKQFDAVADRQDRQATALVDVRNVMNEINTTVKLIQQVQQQQLEDSGRGPQSPMWRKSSLDYLPPSLVK